MQATTEIQKIEEQSAEIQKIEEKYVDCSVQENIRTKDWAAGSNIPTLSDEFVIFKQGTTLVASHMAVTYAPSWLKTIDEPLVNTLDQMIRQLQSGTNNRYDLVSRINVEFTEQGEVVIFNDGPGVEVVIHPAASARLGYEIYVPTLIFGELFQGSNVKNDPNSIIGGTNGIGSKLSNFLSTTFCVETVDKVRGLHFKQIWRDGGRDRCDPVITTLATKAAPYTKLTFTPDYSLFSYKAFTPELHSALLDVVRTRVVLASIYAHFATSNICSRRDALRGHRIAVHYNGSPIQVKGVDDLAAILFPGAPTVHATIMPLSSTSDVARFPWEICAIFTDGSKYGASHLSVVNGIVVKDGSHVKHMMGQILAATKIAVAKILNNKETPVPMSYIASELFLIINAQIPQPRWTGQRKDILSVPLKTISEHIIPKAKMNAIVDGIKDAIVARIMHTTSGQKTKKSGVILPPPDKYHPASDAGGRHSRLCSLLVVEGDSAKNQLEIGIANNMGFSRCGIMSLRGVIINARKEHTIVKTATGTRLSPSHMMKNNVMINALVSILGLDFESKYDPAAPTFAAEMKKLNYGCVIACVDQDLDGKGNILGLLLNIFELLWPNLLRNGFIKWFATPIMRLYPLAKGRVLSFYATAEYDKWIAQGGDQSKYELPKYYKGIGTHSRVEIIHMVSLFYQHLVTFTSDARTPAVFETYFGKDPDLRKHELILPTRVETSEEELRKFTEKTISVSDQIEIETNAYQKDNLDRKLDHIIDGQNQSGRKILDGLIKYFRKKATPQKVSIIGGFVSEKENYHHGELSLMEGISLRAFITPGGKQIPILIPHSHFGSRKCGGDSAAKPRYVYCALNSELVNLIFPHQDYPNLQFHIDDGVRGEPKYFVPIIPMAILESTEVPATGWKIKKWARDVFQVIDNVERMIKHGEAISQRPGGVDFPLDRLELCTYKGSPFEWRGHFARIRNKLYSFGEYHMVDDNTLVITELPLRVWTTPYVAKLENLRNPKPPSAKTLEARAAKAKAKGGAPPKPKRVMPILIQSIDDQSGDLDVKIIVTLVPGSLDILDEMGDLCFTDGIQEYFKLRKKVDEQLNFMGMRGEVVEVRDPREVIRAWFQVRREYYKLRVERELILINLDIKRVSSIIKYIGAAKRLELAKKPVAQMESILQKDGFARIDHASLARPKFIPTSELMITILHGGKISYDYLLNLSDRAKSQEAMIKYEHDIAKLAARHEELTTRDEPFLGAAMWLDELAKVKDVIRRGFATFWKFDAAGKYELA